MDEDFLLLGRRREHLTRNLEAFPYYGALNQLLTQFYAEVKKKDMKTMNQFPCLLCKLLPTDT